MSKTAGIQNPDSAGGSEAPAGPADLIDFDALLTPAELQLRDRVREFVKTEIKPNIARWYEDAHFPLEIVPKMAKLGLLGIHLTGYGCAGRSAVEYGLAAAELEAGDSGLRTFVSVQGSLAMSAIHKHGSEEQKQRWLPAMAAGEAIGCFVVPADTAGITATPIEPKLSMRASIQCEIDLADVRLPADAVLPNGVGLKGPFSCLNEARYGIVRGAMGAARDAFEDALAYSRTRMQFDKPLAWYQMTQQKLVDMALEINKGLRLAHHLGHSPLRHANNLESVRTYEGTDEVHILILGNKITGVPAFR
ncbi:acyl-CoA dehydrogenase family protein [Arthrobacter sp. KK5.5]|uniref:acyl-CoA dehydrogenase family protein n=1 Tax=Arthrobacter sp. KK5.5 TaxID=3373084 RepID=UPI003EE5F93A